MRTLAFLSILCLSGLCLFSACSDDDFGKGADAATTTSSDGAVDANLSDLTPTDLTGLDMAPADLTPVDLTGADLTP